MAIWPTSLGSISFYRQRGLQIHANVWQCDIQPRYVPVSLFSFPSTEWDFATEHSDSDPVENINTEFIWVRTLDFRGKGPCCPPCLPEWVDGIHQVHNSLSVCAWLLPKNSEGSTLLCFFIMKCLAPGIYGACGFWLFPAPICITNLMDEAAPWISGLAIYFWRPELKMFLKSQVIMTVMSSHPKFH